MHSVQKFDPEPLNPQDTTDVLSDVVRLFVSEVQEINDNIRKINEEAIVVHSIKQAEKEIKDEFMKMMAAKQKEIMIKFGLQAETSSPMTIEEAP